MSKKNIWTKAPAREDYEAARHFLSLLFSTKDAAHLTGLLNPRENRVQWPGERS